MGWGPADDGVCSWETTAWTALCAKKVNAQLANLPCRDTYETAAGTLLALMVYLSMIIAEQLVINVVPEQNGALNIHVSVACFAILVPHHSWCSSKAALN